MTVPYPRLVISFSVDYACAAFASLRVIETFTVNGRTLRPVQREIAGELAAMSELCDSADLQEGDGGKLEGCREVGEPFH